MTGFNCKRTFFGFVQGPNGIKMAKQQNLRVTWPVSQGVVITQFGPAVDGGQGSPNLDKSLSNHLPHGIDGRLIIGWRILINPLGQQGNHILLLALKII